MLYQNKKIFPTSSHKNIVICVSGIGGNKKILQYINHTAHPFKLFRCTGTQCFPLYFYEERNNEQKTLNNM